MRVIVKGHQVDLDTEPEMSVGAIATKARWLAGCGAVPFDNWEIRDDDGVLLDPHARSAGFTVLLVNPRPGVGG